MNKIKYIALTVIAALAFYAGHKFADSLPEAEKTTEFIDKVVYEDRIIYKSDGTKIIEKIKVIDKTKVTQTKTTVRKHSLTLSQGLDGFKMKNLYRGTYLRKVSQNVAVGFYYQTDKSYGLAVSISF